MKKFRNSELAISTALALVSSAAEAATNIELWVRQPGTYGSGAQEPKKGAPKVLDLDKLPQQQSQKADVQYGGSAYYRGVSLREVIAQYAPPPQVDLALLHFKNGMIIPLPFREERAMSRLDPLVAVSMSASEGGPFTTEFPPLSKKVEGYVDIRQVSFSGNKLVVKDRWHPDVPEAAQAHFTPWATADSLTGIEFAETSAYYRQFLPSAAERLGWERFRESCQFCHGVRKVGASFGWDWAQPIELHTYRSDPQKLFYHVRYRVEYRQIWEQMPALKHITEEDAGHLWRYMRAVSTAPITRYTPTH
jgi:mono/diheme cytochrome c family protein